MTLSTKHTIVVDFETYYDKDYSLRKLPNFEYVADPRFKVHMMQVIHLEENEVIVARPEEIRDVLARFPAEDTTVVGHNLYFDALILAHYYDYIPAEYADTMGMANLLVKPLSGSASLNAVAEYLLGEVKIAGTLENLSGVRELTDEQFDNLARYGIRDVELTRDILLAMLDGTKTAPFPTTELPLLDLHVRMYVRKLARIDTALLDDILHEHLQKKQEMESRVRELWGEIIGDRDTWGAMRKADTVAEIIKHEGALPPRKRSPTTGQLMYAFAKDDLAFQALAVQSNNLKLLVEAKAMANSSLLESRLARLKTMAEYYDGWAHPLLNYCRAHTGRSSGGDKLNFQNLPKKPANFRHIFRAPEGYKFAIVDSGQIEARVLAVLAGQDDLVEMFKEADNMVREGKDPKRTGDDVYTKMAYKIGAGGNRDLGKATVLGCGFGMGANKFVLTSRAAGNTANESQLLSAWQGWREANPAIVQFWERYSLAFEAAANGATEQVGCITIEPLNNARIEQGNMTDVLVRLPSGRPLIYGGVHKRGPGALVDREGRNLWYGQLVENLVQAVARDVVFYQVAAQPELMKYTWIMVHDEADLVVPADRADELLELAIEALSTSPKWMAELPTIGEGKIADYLTK